MEDKLLEELSVETNWKSTDNGADSLKSTRNSLIDLFGTIGSLRSRSDEEVHLAFMKAYNEDELLALKMLFYARNVRGGLGERKVFRTILKWIIERNSKQVLLNFDNISRFGRWDDFYAFVGTSLEKEAFEFMKRQFNTDILRIEKNRPISLIGKWLKSANSHSEETRKLGQLTAKHFNLKEKEYRKHLSLLRKTLNVTEVFMSKNEWETINYVNVPSKAMNTYSEAFKNHDAERFNEFLSKVEKGEVKINASTLYPYDLVENYMFYDYDVKLNETVEAQWKALPNYIEGENNFLVMADVSGSMSGRPMATSIGLAIYFAERNHGPYKNKFMTFSENPNFVELKGQTLKDNVLQAMQVDWGANTNIETAFELILKVAVDNKLSQEDLPKALIIISDMEFDQAQDDEKKTYFDKMSLKYSRFGYGLPKVVFWNVDARTNTFHADVKTKGVQFISGQSASAFKSLIKGTEFTAYELMIETLSDEMYDSVCIK
jgi:hypothetical protein